VRRTRILVADALPLFRAGVRNLLRRESEFDVVEAASLDELLQRTVADAPDIVLVDLDLPPHGGIAAVTRLGEYGAPHTIVWSLHPTRDSVIGAIRSGASGYLHKQVSPQGLLRALRGVLQGEAPISRHLTSLMIEALHGLDARDRAREKAALLSRRELEVLQRVAHGGRNREIAHELFISEFTVKRHMQNILQKLELPSRNAAAQFYRAAFEEERVA
jgi:two-component system nitrate/nitrite response regulator NarL